MGKIREAHPADKADIERSNPMLMRVLAAVVGVIVLIAVVVTLTTDSGWQAYSNAWVGIVIAYVCIAYTLGSADPLSQLYRKIIR